MSAPNESGRCSIGVANVLSVTSRTPSACAMSPRARRSARNIIGLVGVSQKSIFVFGRIAASTFSMSRMSTNENVSPNRS